MVFVDIGLKEVHKKAIRNEVGVTPLYGVFAGSNNTYTGSETFINNNFLNKSLTWVQSGNNSKYYVELSSLECIGSNISTFALIGSPAVGSPNNYVLFTINDTFIGSKNDTFNVQVEGEIILSRRQ